MSLNNCSQSQRRDNAVTEQVITSLRQAGIYCNMNCPTTGTSRILVRIRDYARDCGGVLRLIGGPELKPKRRVGGGEVRCNFLNICRVVRS